MTDYTPTCAALLPLSPANAAPLPSSHLLATTPVLLLLFAVPISLVFCCTICMH